MLIDKKIGDAYARSLTAGAPRKSDRIGVPGSLSTIGIPQIPMTIVSLMPSSMPSDYKSQECF